MLRLLKSSFLPLVLSAAACVRNVSIHPQNESPIIEAGFLGPLVDLVRCVAALVVLRGFLDFLGGEKWLISGERPTGLTARVR